MKSNIELDVVNSAIDYATSFINKLKRERVTLDHFITKLQSDRDAKLKYRLKKWQIPVDYELKAQQDKDQQDDM